MPATSVSTRVDLQAHRHSSGLNDVLIIDDDPDMCGILEIFFLMHGVKHVHLAGNGEEALAKIDRHGKSFDFLLSDLRMPQVDGAQFLRQLKAHGYDGPIAILSALDEVTVSLAKKLSKDHNLNIVAAIHKPLDFGELERLLLSRDTWSTSPNTSNGFTPTVELLRTALAQNEIVAYLQPKVCISSKTIVGAEALARWDHPEYGTIGPNKFIELADKEGLAEQVTEAVLRSAINSYKQWPSMNMPFKIAINLSVSALRNKGLPDEIGGLLASHGLNSSKFIFEITEDELPARSSQVVEGLIRLRIMGFELSVDDFGTGCSNIERLMEFPFSEIKIDRSFIRDSRADERAKACVELTTRLGRKLGLRLVAEGVETAHDWKFAAAQKIDQAQGFFIAKPMSPAHFRSWMFEGGA